MLTQKKCENCGDAFPCDVEGNCWCKALPLASVPSGKFEDCICPKCLKEFIPDKPFSLNDPLIEGKDYYLNEDGLMVLTAAYLLRRGFCCDNRCKHCPY